MPKCLSPRCDALTALWVTLALAGASGHPQRSPCQNRAEPGPPATLDLGFVLIDSMDRPGGTIGALRHELERLLAPASVQPFWLAPENSDTGPFLGQRPLLIKVIVSRTGPCGRPPTGTLGQVLRKPPSARQPGDTIFVIAPAISAELRRLGRTGPEGTDRAGEEEGRAMARVVLHELIHLLAPDLGHAKSGLMAAHLDGKTLVAEDLAVDPRWLAALRAGLERALSRSPRR